MSLSGSALPIRCRGRLCFWEWASNYNSGHEEVSRVEQDENNHLFLNAFCCTVKKIWTWERAFTCEFNDCKFGKQSDIFWWCCLSNGEVSSVNINNARWHHVSMLKASTFWSWQKTANVNKTHQLLPKIWTVILGVMEPHCSNRSKIEITKDEN
jgi:hypothetical protein